MDQVQDGFFVVNDQYTFARPSWGFGFSSSAAAAISTLCFRFLGDGQLDDEGRALARLAQGRDRAAVFLDVAVAQAQAQAGAFANFLGRKKGIENAPQMFPRDARPVVLDDDADVRGRVSVTIWIRPPGLLASMASCALLMMLSKTCWIWLVSASTSGRLGPAG